MPIEYDLTKSKVRDIPEPIRAETTEAVMIAFKRHIILHYPNTYRVRIGPRDVGPIAKLLHELELFVHPQTRQNVELANYEEIVQKYVGATFRYTR